MPIMDGRGHVLCGGGGLQGSLDGEYLAVCDLRRRLLV